MKQNQTGGYSGRKLAVLVLGVMVGAGSGLAQGTWAGAWQADSRIPRTTAPVTPSAYGNSSQAANLVSQCGVSFKAKRYTAAISLCKQAADMGDAEGIEGLAIVYRETKQCSLAAHYYSMNAAARPAAQNSLGELYWLGCRDLAPDYAKARYLFEAAAKRRWKQASVNLGWMDAIGEGAPQDRKKAISEIASSNDEWDRDVVIALKRPDAPASFKSPDELGKYAADVRLANWLASQPPSSRPADGQHPWTLIGWMHICHIMNHQGAASGCPSGY
jgi:TPR repeat protein